MGLDVAHLRVFSPHSHLFGASTEAELAAAARRGGIRALALTDRGGLFDPFTFQEACLAEGIHPVFGAQIGSSVLYARDERGYENLCFLISAKHLRPEADVEALLREHGEGIVALPPEAAAVPVAYHAPERRRLHRILRAVARGRLAKETNAEAECLLSAAAMRRRFSREALRRACEIAESCTLRLKRRRPILPHPPLPDGDTAASRLFALSTEGIRRRYKPVPPIVMRRLLQEIEVIHELDFDAYFVLVHEIVEFARSRDIPVVGRGSAANSLVAYALGITQVDPIRHELLFERFLNRARRDDPPDIDLDLDWRRRDEILDHVYETYGRDRVAMICTFQTLRLRAAFREVAKTLGVSPPEVDALSKLLPAYDPESLDELPEMRRFPGGEPYETALAAARALQGLPRHLSIHSGGIVVADCPLTRYLPLQRSRKGLVVTQFDMHGVEKTGLVKIDLLGHRSLAVVFDAAGWAGVDLETIPESDAKCGALLSSGETMGVFQLESPAMRSLLQKMEGTTQDDAMVGLSLVRPGPAGSGMKDAYVRRNRGEEKPDSEILARLLPKTHGVLLYQEDVLRLAKEVGGLTMERANELRRGMSHWKSEEPMRALMAEFYEGARSRGVSAEEAALLWIRITSFAAYAYSKAHAATYARIAYQALYLKAHHPAAFFAAVLANEGGFYEARAYLEEARRCGVETLLPGLNASAASETVEKGAIRIGLKRVRNLSEKTLAAILARRPFLSLTDFLHRVPEASRREAQHLVLTGCMDDFDGTRPEKLWRVMLHEKRTPERDLFGGRALLPPERTLPAVREYSKARKVATELELLGLCPTAHPIALFAEGAKRAGAVATTDLAHLAGKRVRLAGWLTTSRRVRTKKGEWMKFVTLEDECGVVEVDFHPEAYRRCGHLLSGYGPYLVSGRVENHLGAIALVAEDIDRLTLS